MPHCNIFCRCIMATILSKYYTCQQQVVQRKQVDIGINDNYDTINEGECCIITSIVQNNYICNVITYKYRWLNIILLSDRDKRTGIKSKAI